MAAPEATPRPAPRHIRSSLPSSGRPGELGCLPSAPPAPDERPGLAPPIFISRVPAPYPFPRRPPLQQEDRCRCRDAGSYGGRGRRCRGEPGTRVCRRHKPGRPSPGPGCGVPLEHAAAQRRAVRPARGVPARQAGEPGRPVPAGCNVRAAGPVSAGRDAGAERRVSTVGAGSAASTARNAGPADHPCARAERDGKREREREQR